MLGYGVKETTATTGTGTLTLTAATNFPRFSNVFIDGDLCCYSLLSAAGEPLECGIGTYTATNTLARTLPLVTYVSGTYNNNSPTAVTLAGTTTVICTGVPQSGYPFIPGIGSAAGQKIYGGQNISLNADTSIAIVALKIYVFAIQLNAARPITGIQARLSVAAAAGKIMRIGLYRVGTDGVLGKLLQTSGDIAADTTGVKTYTFATPVTYPPGWYGVAMISDGAPTPNARGSTSNVGAIGWLGGAATNNSINYITTTAATAVFPDPFSGAITNVESVTSPAIFLITA